MKGKLNSGKLMPKTVQHKVRKVFSILNYAHRQEIDRDRIEPVLRWIREIDLPKAGGTHP